MKRLLFLLLPHLVVRVVSAQAPQIEWQNTIGGSDGDELRALQQTTDGGYILGGSSRSGISGDKTEAEQGDFDYWVVKLDEAGNITWQNTIEGSDDDLLSSIEQTADGGYIVGGHSDSPASGDKTEDSQGSYDYWVIKLDAAGNIVWQNTIGGSNGDFLHSIRQTTDGGYILGGYSNSLISGDKTEASDYSDYWIVKLNAAGSIVWQNTIGGDSEDYLRALELTSDGGYILGGYSASVIWRDKTEGSQGSYDYWVVKLDSAGNITWQNTIGGSYSDELFAIQQTRDGGYILGGNSSSENTGDKTEEAWGFTTDYWVIKLDITGNIEWQNTIGGTNEDFIESIQSTTDGGYLLGGWSYSELSGDKTEASQGAYDYWVVKLDAAGASNGKTPLEEIIGKDSVRCSRPQMEAIFLEELLIPGFQEIRQKHHLVMIIG